MTTDQLKFDEVYREVREKRQSQQYARRQARHKLLPIDNPHAIEEFRVALGKALEVSVTSKGDWREKILDAIEHARSERNHLCSIIRRVRKHVQDGDIASAILATNERFPPHDGFEWAGCQEDTAEAHRIIEERRKEGAK